MKSIALTLAVLFATLSLAQAANQPETTKPADTETVAAEQQAPADPKEGESVPSEEDPTKQKQAQ